MRTEYQLTDEAKGALDFLNAQIRDLTKREQKLLYAYHERIAQAGTIERREEAALRAAGEVAAELREVQRQLDQLTFRAAQIYATSPRTIYLDATDE